MSLKNVFNDMGDDLRPQQQCPWETEDNGYRFQTKDLVSVLVVVGRLPECD